eukprot:1710169-Rhodomonas_salina.3
MKVNPELESLTLVDHCPLQEPLQKIFTDNVRVGSMLTGALALSLGEEEAAMHTLCQVCVALSIALSIAPSIAHSAVFVAHSVVHSRAEHIAEHVCEIKCRALRIQMPFQQICTRKRA